MRYFFTILYCIISILHPGAAQAEEKGANRVVENISILGKKGSSEVLELRLSQKITPIVFQLGGDKPRIVFDFMETGYDKKAKRVFHGNGDLIEKIRVGLHHSPVVKTRVVIDLVKEGRHVTQQSFDSSTNTFTIAVFFEGGTDEDRGIAEKSKPAAVQRDKAVIEDIRDELSQQKQRKNSADLRSSTVISSAGSQQTGREGVSSGKEDGERGESIFETGDERGGAAEGRSGTEKSKKEAPIIKNVSFERNTNDKEMILFRLSGFFPPVVFATEENKLRVVCDFLDGILGYGIDEIIDTGGKYIQQVRITTHSSPEKVRVVLDLAEKFNYDLKQVFFKEDNLFVVIISNLGEK